MFNIFFIETYVVFVFSLVRRTWCGHLFEKEQEKRPIRLD